MRAFEILRDQTGRALPWKIPPLAGRAVGLIEQARAAVFGTPPLLTMGTVSILDADWALDSTLAERELGYQWRPLVDGLTATIAALGVRS